MTKDVVGGRRGGAVSILAPLASLVAARELVHALVRQRIVARYRGSVFGLAWTLIAPAIHDVAELPLGELMKALADLVRRARAGSLRSSEMSDPTITVTNLGDQGVDEVFPIIYPPQVAIVGFGRLAPRPWAEDGMIGAVPAVVASLGGDHGASDGHRGARLLAAIAALLQEPETLA